MTGLHVHTLPAALRTLTIAAGGCGLYYRELWFERLC
jgi:hypothetical protein